MGQEGLKGPHGGPGWNGKVWEALPKDWEESEICVGGPRGFRRPSQEGLKSLQNHQEVSRCPSGGSEGLQVVGRPFRMAGSGPETLPKRREGSVGHCGGPGGAKRGREVLPKG